MVCLRAGLCVFAKSERVNSNASSAFSLVAHRGYMHRYPENTLRALRAALEAGAKYIEFDIQMNADHEFVVLHDVGFERTAGVSQSVFSLDSKACIAISVHQPERFGQRFFPTPVSLLEDILKLTVQYPGAVALVEIKKESIEHWGLQRVMDKLLRQLEPYQDSCMLISFSDAAIEYALQHSALKTGWVFEEYTQVQRSRAAGLKPDFLMMDYEVLAEGEMPWPEFKRWMLYDVMDREIAQIYYDAGVELIETADIQGMLAVFPEAGRLK